MSKYYDEGGALKYVMSAQELTDLAKEVAAACAANAPSGEGGVVPEFTDEPRHVLERRNIEWEEA